MKYLIIATLLLSFSTNADVHLKIDEIKGDTKAAAKIGEVEGEMDKPAGVIDNAEESAEEVSSAAIQEPGQQTTGQERRRGDVKMGDVKVTKELEKSSTKAASGLPTGERAAAKPYIKIGDIKGESERSSEAPPKAGKDETHTEFPKNAKRGIGEGATGQTRGRGHTEPGPGQTGSTRDAASGIATGKRNYEPKLDTDDDGDSVPTEDEACNAADLTSIEKISCSARREQRLE